MASRACTEIFGPVERRATGVGDQLEPGLAGGLLEDGGGHVPLLVGADELVLAVVLGRQLEVVVVQAEVAQQAEHEVQQVLHLRLGSLDGDVRVRVVLGHAAHPGEAVHDTGLLEAVHRPELEQPQRQVAVRAAAGPVDEVVHRAVHRLEAVLRPFEVDGREHALGEVRQVARGVEQPVLGDVRGADVVEPLLDVPPADVVLHLPLDDAALGVVDRQPRAQLVGEGVEVQLGAELAVVALLGLGQPLEVGLEVVLGRPGGAVDPLQLRVLLGAAPVGGGTASQLEGVADQLGGRQVRAAAEVLPRQLAVAAVVVVDGQLAAADFSVRPVGGVPGVRP